MARRRRISHKMERCQLDLVMLRLHSLKVAFDQRYEGMILSTSIFLNLDFSAHLLCLQLRPAIAQDPMTYQPTTFPPGRFHKG